MLIGFEVSSLQGFMSGVGYYTQNLVTSIMEVAPEHQYVLFSNRDIANVSPLSLMPRGGNETVYQRHFRVRSLWMQTVLPFALRAVRPDVCHFTNYMSPLVSACPSVVTMYDMTVFVTPRYHQFKKLVLDRTLIPRVARRADAIITVSNSARQDILRYLKVPKEKVRVIMLAAAPSFRPVTDTEQLETIRKRYGLDSPYILYVGTIEPRKNLVRLVQAFAQLKKRRLPHKLVIVGQSGWHVGPLFHEVERLGLTKDILFTGYVPTEDLPALYTMAESMVFPSLYEGFGLPVIEAMACGAPVVTSRNSSLVEVAGDAALLVDPLSVDDIAEALYRLHTDKELREELRQCGLARAADFTWEATARQTLALYERFGSASPHSAHAHVTPIAPVRATERD
jgi:glycosyltransferase involved in cell wall biosynthesis